MKTTLECPVCGAHFSLPENEHSVSGIAIGHNSNLGRLFMQLEESNEMNVNTKPSKSQLRLETLKQYGYDTSSYTIFNDNKGGSVVTKSDDNGVSFMSIDDLNELERKIMKDGFVPNRNLFTRWMTAQYFQWTRIYGSITNALKAKGYEYSWMRIIKEIEFICKSIKNDDMNSLYERELWFNKNLVIEMSNHYINEIVADLFSILRKKGKGNNKYYYIPEYGKLPENNAVNTVKETLNGIISKINDAQSYVELLRLTVEFNKKRPKVRTRKSVASKAFYNAFKGSGSYNILKNLIRFHGVRIKENDEWLSLYKSLEYVNKKAIEHRNDGYKLLGILKDVISYNEFDFNKRMKELND